MIDVSLFLVIIVIMIYLLVCLIYLLFLYAFWVIVSNTLNAKEILKIYLIEQKIYTNHQDEWYILSQWFIMLCLWLLYMFILCIELHCTSACPVREIKWVWNFNCLGLLYLTPLSTIFQLYRARGAQFYWWMRLEYLEKTSDL